MQLRPDTLSLFSRLASSLLPLAFAAGCAPSAEPGEAPPAEEVDEGGEASDGGAPPPKAPVDRKQSAMAPTDDATAPGDGAAAATPGDDAAREPASAIAATYQVGPGKAYPDLQSIAPILKPGDVVDVYAKGSPYAGNLVFSRPGTAAAKITIRGVRVNGARPAIAGGSNTVEFRANHYVFQGFDVSGGSERVLFHHAHDITVRDTFVHDAPAHGILGADVDSGSLTLEYVEVARCGSGTQKHLVYIATDESAYPDAVFRMQHSYVHDGNGGNNVKSRAGRNELYYNWIEGAFYREIELIGPDGQDPSLKREDSDVVGNVFYQTKGSYVARVGGDGTGSTAGRYRFLNNTFILRPGGSQGPLQAFDEIETLELHNNVFFRLGGGALQIVRDTDANWVSGAPRVSGSKNWVPSGSSGLPAGLTGTVTGSDPKFVNAAGRDLRAASGSPLINGGASSYPSPAGYAFPAPLTQAAFLPPTHALEPLGAALPRLISGGVVDISAFE